MMAFKTPGKAHRHGITLFELQRMFPDEVAARQWFEEIIWPEGPQCPHCGSVDVRKVKSEKPMPYRCGSCRKHYSVKTGTLMADSPLPLLKWVYAIYLDTTSLKGVASMKLHRELGITQKTAWFMQQRIREAFAEQGDAVIMGGPAEDDETAVGGIRKNMSNAKLRELRGTGRGSVGKAIMVGVKDRETKQVRAEVVDNTDSGTLQGFVVRHESGGATVYTDDAAAYAGLPFKHETVRHSGGEYVNGIAHTNGIESFWSMFKRAHKGTFHKISQKHLQRYINEFAGRHNIRDMNTICQMKYVAAAMFDKRLTYAQLAEDNGLASAARS